VLTTLRPWATQLLKGHTATREEGHEGRLTLGAAPDRYISAHLHLRQQRRQVCRRRQLTLAGEAGQHLGRVARQQLWQGVDPRLQHVAEPLALTAEPPR